MKDSMIFYRSFAEAIECLDEEDQLKALWAIINYALDGEEPDISGASLAVFKMAKPQMDVNIKRYENGKKGGRPKTEDKPKENQKETKDKPKEKNAEPNYNYNYNSNLNSNNKKHISTSDEAFEQFWELYPKKKSKGQAKKTWDKIKPDKETIDLIMQKLPELINSPDWQKDGGQFIPYPSTWLNAQGWLDEVSKKSWRNSNNQFSNFDQREYDELELERKLLSRGG